MKIDSDKLSSDFHIWVLEYTHRETERDRMRERDKLGGYLTSICIHWRGRDRLIPRVLWSANITKLGHCRFS